MLVLKKIENSKIKRVCITHTVYTLLQYLLLSSEDEIKSTYFFFSTTRFSSFFPNSVVFTCKRGKLLKSKYLKAYLFLLSKHLLWPFIKHSEIYAQDHLITDFILLQGSKYILLDDGLATYLEHRSKMRLKKLPFYPNGIHTWGNGKNCTARLLSHSPAENSFLRKKPFILIDIQKLWQESSQEKRDFILQVFDISSADLQSFEKFDNLILTQCFSEEKMISEEAKIKCYRNIIKHYGLSPEKTVFKTHPKETTDYSASFPGFHVCSKPIPVELIAMHLQKRIQVYTVSSSGVFIFPKEQITWCDTDFSPELKNKYNSWPFPFPQE